MNLKKIFLMLGMNLGALIQYNLAIPGAFYVKTVAQDTRNCFKKAYIKNRNTQTRPVFNYELFDSQVRTIKRLLKIGIVGGICSKERFSKGRYNKGIKYAAAACFAGAGIIFVKQVKERFQYNSDLTSHENAQEKINLQKRLAEQEELKMQEARQRDLERKRAEETLMQTMKRGKAESEWALHLTEFNCDFVDYVKEPSDVAAQSLAEKFTQCVKELPESHKKLIEQLAAQDNPIKTDEISDLIKLLLKAFDLFDTACKKLKVSEKLRDDLCNIAYNEIPDLQLVRQKIQQ